MKFEPQGGELQASWGDEPADPSPPQHGAPESEENPWQDLVESPAMPTPDADAAQAPDAARAPVRGGMQDEWGPRPGEVWGEMLYCVGCEQFMAPEAFHKSMQKWTLPARICIVCRDDDAAQAPEVKSTTRYYIALLASSTWPLTLSTSPCRSGRCLREHALLVEMPSGRLLCNHRRRTSPLPRKKWGISAAAFLTRFRPYPCHGPPSATLQIPCPEPGRKRAPIDAPPARKA